MDITNNFIKIINSNNINNNINQNENKIHNKYLITAINIVYFNIYK